MILPPLVFPVTTFSVTKLSIIGKMISSAILLNQDGQAATDTFVGEIYVFVSRYVLSR